MQFWYWRKSIFKKLNKIRKEPRFMCSDGGIQGLLHIKLCPRITAAQEIRNGDISISIWHLRRACFFLFENMITSILMNIALVSVKMTRKPSTQADLRNQNQYSVDYIAIDFLLWNTSIYPKFHRCFFSHRNIKSVNFYMHTENISQLWCVICCVSHTIVKMCEHILKPKKM